MSILTNTGISGRMFQELNQRFDSNVEAIANKKSSMPPGVVRYEYDCTYKTDGSLKEKVKSIGKGTTYIPVAIAAVVETCFSLLTIAFSKLIRSSKMNEFSNNWAGENLITLLGSAYHALGHITLPFVKSDRTYSKRIAHAMFATAHGADFFNSKEILSGAKLGDESLS